VLLDGHPEDVAAQARASGLADAPAGPPELPPHRWSLRPTGLRSLAAANGPNRFVAQVGVGVAHASAPQPPRTVAAEVVALHRRIKDLFDPTGRLGPGRDPLAAALVTGAA
jgi:hypothetical protein